jgi:hypothetical protein
VVVQFRGAMRDDTQTVPYVVDVSGMYTEMDGGTPQGSPHFRCAG